MAPEKTVGYYKKVSEMGIPVCAIWGTDDRTMPYYQAEQLKSIFPQIHFYTFADSGHIFLYDEGERTCEILDRELLPQA